MDKLMGIFVILHILGWAMLLGAAIATMKTPKVTPGMFHGALTALVGGLLALTVWEMGDFARDPNHIKIGIKLAITIIITVLVALGKRKESVSKGYLGGIAGLVVANIAIAVLW